MSSLHEHVQVEHGAAVGAADLRHAHPGHLQRQPGRQHDHRRADRREQGARLPPPPLQVLQLQVPPSSVPDMLALVGEDLILRIETRKRRIFA